MITKKGKQELYGISLLEEHLKYLCPLCNEVGFFNLTLSEYKKLFIPMLDTRCKCGCWIDNEDIIMEG